MEIWTKVDTNFPFWVSIGETPESTSIAEKHGEQKQNYQHHDASNDHDSRGPSPHLCLFKIYNELVRFDGIHAHFRGEVTSGNGKS